MRFLRMNLAFVFFVQADDFIDALESYLWTRASLSVIGSVVGNGLGWAITWS